MAYAVQFRRGTTAEHASFTGAAGEITVNTTTNQLVVHDGVTVGGHVIGSGGGNAAGASVGVSDTAPVSPSAGDLWYNTDNGTMNVYYNDGSSSQWVGTSGPAGATGPAGPAGDEGGSVTIYASISARDAAVANEGDLAFLSDSDTLHINNGSEWIKVWAGPDELPSWSTELPNSVALNADGTTTTLTVTATDPEGFDITYTYDTSPSNQAQATIVNNNDGTFTLTPSTTESDAGSFIFRAKASDGIHVISTTTTAALTFSNDITFSDSEPGINVSSVNSFGYIQADGTPGGDTNSILGARSSELLSGRRYFEVKITSSTGPNFFIGIARSDETLTGYFAPGSVSLYAYTNGWYGNGTYGSTPSPQFNNIVSPNVIQIAYDNTTDEVWFNKNNGTWWPNNPASGSGFAMFGTSGQEYSLVFSSAGSVNITGDIITNSQTFNYSVPTGFTGY